MSKSCDIDALIKFLATGQIPVYVICVQIAIDCLVSTSTLNMSLNLVDPIPNPTRVSFTFLSMKYHYLINVQCLADLVYSLALHPHPIIIYSKKSLKYDQYPSYLSLLSLFLHRQD